MIFKGIKKLGKIALIIVLTLILISVGSYAVLRSVKVQNWLSHKVAAYLSEKLKTRVEVSGVDISLFRSVILEGVYVQDQHMDTLLYAGKFNLNISQIKLNRQELHLNSIDIINAKFYLKYYKGEEFNNMDFLINAFSSPDTTSSTGPFPWKIRNSDLQLKNVSFILSDANEPITLEGVDYFNINAKHIDGSFKNIKLQGDTISGTIEKLSFEEKSGFVMKSFSADVIVCSTLTQCDNLLIETPYSKISADVAFIHDRYQDYLDFNNSMRLKGMFKESRVSFKDIGYFAPALIGFDQTVLLSGEVKGKINALKGKNINIRYGRNTFISGNFNLTGLPNIEETFIDCKIEDLRTDKKDIESIQMPPYKELHYLSLPDNISLLETVEFKGKFTGFYNDFVAYGEFGSALGKVQSDINLKFDGKTRKTVYNGNIASINFDIGKFLGQSPMLGPVTLNANIKGTGLKKNEVKAELNGDIKDIRLNGYRYKNVMLSGKIAKGLFEGDVVAKDDNFDFDFSGSIDISKEIPVFDFTSEIRQARLAKLNLIKRDPSSELSTKLSIHFSGNTLDNIEGEINIDNTLYSEKGRTYELKHLSLNAESYDDYRILYLTSDYADAHLKGKYKVDETIKAISGFISNYLPALSKNKTEYYSGNQVVDFSVKLKNTEPITSLFLPALKVKPNANFTGTFNSSNNSLVVDGIVPEVRYNKKVFKSCYLKSGVENNKLVLNAGCNQFLFNDSTLVNGLQFSGKAADDSILFNIQIANHPKEETKANINGIVSFDRADKFDLHFLSSEILIKNEPWMFKKENYLSVDGSTVSVKSFNLSNKDQALRIDGVVSKNTDDQLKIGFSNFQMNSLDHLNVGKFNGILNGEAKLSGLYSDLHFSSNLDIQDLSVNGDTLGKGSIISTYDTKSKIVGVVANTQKGSIKIIDIKGQYNTNLEENNLDFDIVVQKFYLKTLSRYLNDYVSNIRGIVSAELKLKGDIEKPLVTGKLRLQKASFVFNYLNTQYNFADEFQILENEIFFKNITLYDVRGNTANATGRLKHKHFRDWRFDIELSPKNFQTLNTNSSDNSLYYGSAYTTGDVYILGTVDNLKLNIDLKSDKGTNISIPFTDSEEVSEGSFITFVSHDTTKAKIEIAPLDLSGIILNMDLEVTPDAEVKMIFDEKIGDEISVTGNGNIRMEINTLGDFKMYGDYFIEEGEYLFTLQSVINKKFRVERGGSIKWTGDPQNADINMTTYYKTSASLYDLTQDENQKNKVPVYCKMYLSNKLMNPTIKFDIEIPNLNDDNIANIIKKNTSTDQDKTNQVFSLLMISKFKPPNEATYNATATSSSSATSGIGANASELLSNQLSNYLSQISKDVNIGVNYRAKDAISSEQIQLALSTQLFNDRIIIDGNFGVAGQSPNNLTNSQASNNIVGDFTTEYKVFQDGKLRLKGFNRTNPTTILYNSNSPYTQGFGIFYREEYNSLKELFDRYRNKKKNPEE